VHILAINTRTNKWT